MNIAAAVAKPPPECPQIPTLSKSKNFRFNKAKYYWYLNDYLYFPDIDWDAVRIEGIFEEDISVFTCAADSCVQKTDQPFNVPDYLFGEIEQYVLKELTMSINVPANGPDDSQNSLR